MKSHIRERIIALIKLANSKGYRSILSGHKTESAASLELNTILIWLKWEHKKIIEKDTVIISPEMIDRIKTEIGKLPDAEK